MPDIRTQDLVHCNNKLFLPMIIKVLENDINQINKQPFKLIRPYLKIVEEALKLIRKDLKSAELYLIRNNMKVYKWESDKDSTTYVFLYGGVENHNKYLNEEIREKCEEILSKYFSAE